MKSIIGIGLLVSTVTVPVLAEKLVDPATVAPEYRDAAEKRRAEQVRQHECAHKADVQKVMARDRTAFLLQCLQTEDAAK